MTIPGGAGTPYVTVSKGLPARLTGFPHRVGVLTQRGSGPFSCPATGEERYFCSPLDRCGLDPLRVRCPQDRERIVLPPQVLPASSLRPGRSDINHIGRPAFALPRSHAAGCFLCTPTAPRVHKTTAKLGRAFLLPLGPVLWRA